MVLGALVSGLVAGSFGAYNALNADHFTIVTHSEIIKALEQEDKNFIPRTELEATLIPMKEDIRDIKTDVKEIRQALGR